MSNPDALEWFKSNFPQEYDLVQDIAMRSQKVFKQMLAPTTQGWSQPIFIGVGNHPDDPSRVSIGMNDPGKIFVGIMAKAILDSLTGEFEGLLEGGIAKGVLDKKVKEIVSQQLSAKGFKICPSCKSENLPKARHCDQCTKEL